MQTAELKGEIEIRLARAAVLLDPEQTDLQKPQSSAYYRAQTELTAFLLSHVDGIIGELERWERVRQVGIRLAGYPDKRQIPGSEWEELREALGIQS